MSKAQGGYQQASVPVTSRQPLGPHCTSTWKGPGFFTAMQAAVCLGPQKPPCLVPFLLSLGSPAGSSCLTGQH